MSSQVPPPIGHVLALSLRERALPCVFTGRLGLDCYDDEGSCVRAICEAINYARSHDDGVAQVLLHSQSDDIPPLSNRTGWAKRTVHELSTIFADNQGELFLGEIEARGAHQEHLVFTITWTRKQPA